MNCLYEDKRTNLRKFTFSNSSVVLLAYYIKLIYFRTQKEEHYLCLLVGFLRYFNL